MTTDNLLTANAPPDAKWSFSGDVTESFDDMLQRSVPNYDEMRKMVTDASCWFLDRHRLSASDRPLLVDLGASRGSGVAPIVDRVGARARYLAIEQSEPMLEVLHERFDGWGEDIFRIESRDLRDGYPPGELPATVVLSVLTLQFVPIEYRQSLLRGIYDGLRHGGGLIIVEKVLGEADETNRLLQDLYWGLKRENGYTQEAVERKALSLEGVLVPLPAKFNEAFFRGAGFDLVETAWSWMSFRGWICLKR